MRTDRAPINFSPSPILAAGKSRGLQAPTAIGTRANGPIARVEAPFRQSPPREAIGAAAEPSSPRRAGIRPLALAPMTAFEPARLNGFMRSGPNGGSSSGALFSPATGGESGGEDLNPSVTLTGGGGNSGGGDGSGGGSSGGGSSGGEGDPKPEGQKITGSGDATLKTLIPVGTIMSVEVAPPSGGYALKTVKVEGMSDISWYMSFDATAAPPATMEPEKNVNTTPTPSGDDGEARTKFVVDATPRQYDIKVTATYTLNGVAVAPSGETTIHFTSATPKTASLSAVGQAGFSLTTAGGDVKLALDSDPMRIVSQTEAAATFGGEFMFMQLVNTYRSVTIHPGEPISSDTGSFYIDDRERGHLPATGYRAVGELPDKSGLKEAYSWTLGPGETPQDPFDMTDTPAEGGLPINAKEIVMNDSFRSYLMFKPAGGVWIALSQYNWWYQVAARNEPIGGWLIVGVLGPIPGIATTPTGDDAFPTWHGRMSSHPPGDEHLDQARQISTI